MHLGARSTNDERRSISYSFVSPQLLAKIVIANIAVSLVRFLLKFILSRIFGNYSEMRKVHLQSDSSFLLNIANCFFLIGQIRKYCWTDEVNETTAWKGEGEASVNFCYINSLSTALTDYNLYFYVTPTPIIIVIL